MAPVHTYVQGPAQKGTTHYHRHRNGDATMNPVIAELLNTHNTSEFKDWAAPLSQSLYRYLHGTININTKSAQDWVNMHSGTMHALTGKSLLICENHLFTMLINWRAAGLITFTFSKTDSTVDFAGDWKKLANEPIRPLLEEPEPWDTDFGGNGTRPLVSGRPLSVVSKDQIEALNATQATPFTINLFILTRALANKECFSEAPMELKALEWAKEHYGKDYFLPLFLDWRGRIYTDSGALCSYQGGDLHRALCDFSDCDTIEEGSDELDHFLDSIETEYGVTVDNYVAVMQEDVPSEYNSKSRFFCRLRAAAAIEEVLLTGKTRYILQQDATCSGMGHIACIMRDEKLARKTALLGTVEQADDLYTETATTAVNTPRFFTYREKECDFDISCLLEIDEVRAELSNRKQAKKTVMVTAYGSSVMGNARGWLEDSGFVPEEVEGAPPSHDVLSATSWDDCPTWMDTGFVFTITAAQERGFTPAQVFLCLANAYSRALDKNHSCIQRFIGHLRGCYDKVFTRDGSAPTWTNPVGMTCSKTKVESSNATRSITISGKKVTPFVVEKVQSAAGQAPNFVHSVDSAVATMSIVDAMNEGFPVAMIHDSWGTSPSKALRMRQLVRDNMVAMHSRNLVATIEENAGKAPLSSGSWDLNTMSTYLIGA